MSYSDDDGRACANVEVIMPTPDVPVPHSSVGSDAAATTASSATLDVPSLVERAIAKLPPDLAAQAVDKKRKAKSQDPGWQYGWWPDPSKKDFVQCIFCKKVVPAGIKRFKQHLAGGYGDAIGCPSCPEVVRKEMAAYLKKNARSVLVVNLEDEEEQDDAAAEEPGLAAEEPAAEGAFSSKSAKELSLEQLDSAKKKGKQLPQAA